MRRVELHHIVSDATEKGHAVGLTSNGITYTFIFTVGNVWTRLLVQCKGGSRLPVIVEFQSWLRGEASKHTVSAAPWLGVIEKEFCTLLRGG